LELTGAGSKRRRRLRELVPVAVWLLTVAVTVALVTVVVLTPEDPTVNPGDLYAFPIFVTLILSLGSVGGLLATRLPENVIGWMLLVAGLCMALAVFIPSSITYLQATGRPIAGLEGAALLGIALFQIGLILAGSVILVFPSGRLEGRGRPVLAAIAVGLVLSLVASLLDPLSNGSVDLSNPLAVPALAPIVAPLNALGGLLLILGFGAAAALLVLRLRRSQGDERRQLAWFAYAAVFLAVSLPLGSLPIPEVSALGLVLVFAAFCGLPVAIAIAITKYRLYEIDRLINRTLVYVPLLAILGGVFAALTVVLQKVFVQLTGDTSDTAVVFATLVVVGVFTPLRKSLDAAVERRFKARPVTGLAPAGGPAATSAGVDVGVLVDDPVFIAAIEGVIRRLAAERTGSNVPAEPGS
jgi:hypothetical protein